jgi:SAM-dependent methyltransferase
MKRPKLAKTKFGFYQYHPKPTEQYLRRYYEEKYFQEGRGSYAIRYKAEEVDYFRLKARLIYLKTSQLIDLSRKVAFLDIGCGEGWILNEFKEKGHEDLTSVDTELKRCTLSSWPTSSRAISLIPLTNK